MGAIEEFSGKFTEKEKGLLVGCIAISILLVLLAFTLNMMNHGSPTKDQGSPYTTSGYQEPYSVSGYGDYGGYNPTTTTQAAGFSVLRPVAWNFEGSGYGVGDSLYNTKATVAFSNIAGVDLTIGVNGTSDASDSIIKFSKPGAQICGWFGSVDAVDEVGDTMSVTWDTYNNYGKIGLPAGKQAVITGLITGPSGPDDTTYSCGGPSGGVYRWTVTYQTALDQYNIQHADSGTLTGKFQ